MATIDDRWIRQPRPDVRSRRVGRTRQRWAVIAAAFVICFSLALAAVELLH